MTRLRALVASVLVLLTLPLLAGCDVGGSLITEARIGAALRELTTSLEELDGISASYTDPVVQGDYTYSFDFTIQSDGASVDDIVAAIERSRDTFAEPLFAEQHVNFNSVDAGDAGSLEIQVWIGEEELAGELALWGDVHKATGFPVSLSIYALPEDPDSYYTGIGIHAFADDVDLAALRPLTDASSATAVDWGFMGLYATGGLPPDDVVALFARLREILPVTDFAAPAPGIELQWSSVDTYLSVTLARETVVPLVDDPALPQLRALVAAIGDSGLIDTISVQPSYSTGDGLAMISFAPCAGESFRGPDDDALFALLNLAALAPGSHAGVCALS